jgi:acyl dehydratase
MGVPSVGDPLPEWTVESVDAQRMKTMAALLADPNPIHWDVDAVRSLGLGERPVNQGPSNMAYVANMLAAWAGGHEHLVSLRVRFLANVFAGDRLTAGGTVVALEPTSDGSLATCEVWLRRGEDTVLTGRAQVTLDDRSR